MIAWILAAVIWAVSQTPSVINKIDYGYAHTNFGGTEYVSLKIQDFDFAAAIDSNNIQIKWDFTKEIVSHMQ